MKKFSRVLCALFAVAATVSNAQEVKQILSVRPVDVKAGEECFIYVDLPTVVKANSISFDVLIPQGLTVVKETVRGVTRPVTTANTDLKDATSITVNGDNVESFGFQIKTNAIDDQFYEGDNVGVKVKASVDYKGVPGLNHVSSAYQETSTFIPTKFRIGELGANGYSSYSSSKNVVIEGEEENPITSYYAKYDGENVVLTKTDVVSNEVGAILKGKEGATIYGICAENADDPKDANDLVASIRGIDASTVNEPIHVLSTEDGVTGFYKWNGWIPASKSYLKGITNPVAKVIIRDETGIEEICAEDLDGVIFNLNGQKVNEAKKGIYVVNGKKVMF